MPDHSDSDLVAAARAGDRDAFAAIVARHQRAVIAVVYATTCDGVLADDIAQDVFVVAWRELARLEDPARLASWLYGIARKRALHTLRWRRDKRERPLEVDVPAGGTPFDQLADHEREQRVIAALARVPETYREALVLYYGDDRSAGAIARTLGISVDAAHQRLSRGRACLAADEALAVERQLAARRRDLVAGVIAAIAGVAMLAPGRAEAATHAARAIAPARGAWKLGLAAGAALVLAGTGYVASAARATPAPVPVAGSTDRASTSPDDDGRAQPAAPAHAGEAPALPAAHDDEPTAPPTDDVDAPAVAADDGPSCDVLGEHWAQLHAAADPDDAYHALRRPDWIAQEARMTAQRCASWTPTVRACVGAASSVYDLFWKCAEAEPMFPLSLGKHVAAEGGDDLSCAHVASHVASLYEIDPDRLATVPPEYRSVARESYAVMRREMPEQIRRDCEAQPWTETRRRCNLLGRADYLLNCAP